MSTHPDIQATIAEARAALSQAVKIDSGRRAMEGDIESAYNLLGDALDWLRHGEAESAKGAILEAFGLLGSEASRTIAEDHRALDDAIRLLEPIAH